MYCQIFEPLVELDLSQTLKLALGNMETNQAPLALFKYLKKRIDSATRVELHIDIETCEFPTLLKMCLSPVSARPGVSVCD